MILTEEFDSSKLVRDVPQKDSIVLRNIYLNLMKLIIIILQLEFRIISFMVYVFAQRVRNDFCTQCNKNALLKKQNWCIRTTVVTFF